MKLTDATFTVDTVSPLDRDGLAALAGAAAVTVRLPALVRGAARSRRLADQHIRLARHHLDAARSARSLGDDRRHRDCLDEAGEARRRALACSAYAGQCEQAANTLALESGFSA